ncbi:MAG TPA: hypothetical protein VI932_06805, partial [Bacteroidota bacterium]|nr:hypothetical protein [Bacteroidota bacterium]
MEKYLGLPPDGSAHGAQIDSLIGLVHWLMFALFVGWGIYFVITLVRFRNSKQKSANYHGVRNHVSTYIEAGVIVVEAVLLVIFSIPIWSERVDAFPSEHGSTVVRIVAEQFAWNIHYPGSDGVFGKTSLALVGTDNPLGLDRTDPAAVDDITTINQLNLPLGKPVIIHLTSKDVIHSLNLTAFRVKQDAVPGLNIPVWFVPTKTSAEIRGEMSSLFSLEEAVSSLTTLSLPSVEDIVPAQDAGREGWLLTADVADAEGSTILSAGDELTADNVNLLVGAGVATVRARIAANLERYVSTENYADAGGAVLLPMHETLTEEAVTGLINAGISGVKARLKSMTDPWVLNETLGAKDGSTIASTGEYLTEEIIT